MYKMFSMRNQETYTGLTVVKYMSHSSKVPVHMPAPSPPYLLLF